MNGQNIRTANKFPIIDYEMEWNDNDIPEEYENYGSDEAPLPDPSTESFTTEDIPEPIKQDAFLNSLQEAQEKLAEMYEDILERQKKLDSKVSKLIENTENKAEQRNRILDNLEDNMKITNINEQEGSLTLLPFFNAVARKHIGKIENLEKKRASRADRLKKRISERDDCIDRIERLNDTNIMLEKVMQYLPNSAPQFVSSLCGRVTARNNSKIESLQKEYMPKLNRKIQESENEVKRFDKRIAFSECKLERCTAMSGVIKSFAILNSSERKGLFARSISSLHDSTLRLNEMKIDRANGKLDKLCEKLDSAETYSERYEIKRKQDRLNERVKSLNKLSDALRKADPKKLADDDTIEEAKNAAIETMKTGVSAGSVENKTAEKAAEATHKPPIKKRTEILQKMPQAKRR